MKPRLVLTGRSIGNGWKTQGIIQRAWYDPSRQEKVGAYWFCLGSKAYEYRVQYQTNTQAQDLS